MCRKTLLFVGLLIGCDDSGAVVEATGGAQSAVSPMTTSTTSETPEATGGQSYKIVYGTPYETDPTGGMATTGGALSQPTGGSLATGGNAPTGGKSPTGGDNSTGGDGTTGGTSQAATTSSCQAGTLGCPCRTSKSYCDGQAIDSDTGRQAPVECIVYKDLGDTTMCVFVTSTGKDCRPNRLLDSKSYVNTSTPYLLCESSS